MYISTGSTMLNLALTGKVDRGWPLGRISNIAGNYSTGKTLLAIEAARMFIKNPPKGINPKIFYCESEASFDPEYAKQLGAPVDKMKLRVVDTIESFFEELVKIIKDLKEEDGVLVILDSLDALSCRKELDREIDKGTYGAEKAKMLGQILRRVSNPIKENNIHLLVISQLRDNINALPWSSNKHLRSGGRALDYYSSQTVWLTDVGKIKSAKTKQVLGVNCKAEIRKNRVATPYKVVEFPIFPHYGIDDALSVIDFLSGPLVDEEYKIITSRGGYYSLNITDNDDANKKRHKENLAKYISYDQNIMDILIKRCQLAWNDLDEECKIDRPAKT